MKEIRWDDDAHTRLTFAEADNSSVAWIGVQSDFMESEAVARIDRKTAAELLAALAHWLARPAHPQDEKDEG